MWQSLYIWSSIVLMHNFFLVIVLLLTSLALPAQRADKKRAQEFANEARKAYQEADYDRAIEYFEKAILNDRRNVEYHIELARSYFGDREYKQAIRIVQPLSRSRKGRGPEQIEAIRIYASCLDLLDKQRQAMKALESGLKTYPDAGELYLEYGLVLLGNEDEEGALAEFEKGILKTPEFARNYLMAAEILAGRGDYGWAILYAEQYLNLERKSGWASDVSRFLFETYGKASKCGIGTCVFRFSQPLEKDTTQEAVLIDPFQKQMSEIYSLSLPENEGDFSIRTLYLVQLDGMELMLQEGNAEAAIAYTKWIEQLQKRDHLEAYNYWLMQNGAPLEFGHWLKDHEREFSAFEAWYYKRGFLAFNGSPILRPQALTQFEK